MALLVTIPGINVMVRCGGEESSVALHRGLGLLESLGLHFLPTRSLEELQWALPFFQLVSVPSVGGSGEIAPS